MINEIILKICSKIQEARKQEFKDPICEGFKNFLEVDKTDAIQPPSEAAEDYLEKVFQGNSFFFFVSRWSVLGQKSKT